MKVQTYVCSAICTRRGIHRVANRSTEMALVKEAVAAVNDESVLSEICLTISLFNIDSFFLVYYEVLSNKNKTLDQKNQKKYENIVFAR